MKNISKFLPAVFLSAAIFVSCADDDSSPVNNNISQVVTIANNGTWIITNYTEEGVDETHHFNNYDFTFGNNGVLTATGSSTYTGTWSVTDSDTNDDSPDDSDIDFNIIFSSSAPAEFIDLNDDWDVLEATANKIRLIDVSGGNGGTDLLTFEKN